jgi:DNA invertase Pin-like site-specific DNA recombinase
LVPLVGANDGGQKLSKTVFYARVSTRDQRLDLQLDAARKIGVKTADIFVEKASGIRYDRPVLAKALAALKPGDTLACYKLDRIGRSLVHVSRPIAELEERGTTSAPSRTGLAPRARPGSWSCMYSAPSPSSSAT